MEESLKETSNFKIVIFCGGFGTRMWPLSRRNAPKQFQPIIEGKSLFEITLARVKKGFSKKDIFFSVPKTQLKFLKEKTKGFPEENYIVEPERRDNLGAVGFVAAYIDFLCPKSSIAAIWSDHLIKEENEFIRLLKSAGEFCLKNNTFIKIGERPRYPSTVHGWIKLEKIQGKIGGHPYFDFEGHIEKPPVEIAEKLFKSKNALISTGYFLVKSDMILDYFRNYAPGDFEHLEKIRKAFGIKDERKKEKIINNEYSKITKTSIEFGLLEKIPFSNQKVILADVGWTDTGTWDMLHDALARTKKENVCLGSAAFIESSGNLVYNLKDKFVAVVGVDDMIIIESGNAILICKKGQSAEVKKLVESLEKEGRKDLT